MKVDDSKNISNIKVSKNCYKQIKLLSIQREVSMQDVVNDILEKVTSKKNINVSIEE